MTNDSLIGRANPFQFPYDRALGNVLLRDGEGMVYCFGAKTLKARLENWAHYSGYGFGWRTKP